MSKEQQLIVPEKNLLKYDNPIRVSLEDFLKTKKAESTAFDLRKFCETTSSENVLYSIMPPRRMEIKGEHFIQEVSSTPATRSEVVQLTKQLDELLEARGAKMTGICPVRRELFTQVFDEIIRQLTIECTEQGLLLLRVRNEIQATISALQSIYLSGVVFGAQKSLAREADRRDQSTKIGQLEAEIAELEKNIEIEKLKCKSVEDKAASRLASFTRRAEEDINFLRKTHDQLKSQLEDVLNQFKTIAVD
nr:dynein light chain [Hymenolepis microstoma]